jgi:hypothetical protein
MPKAYVIYLREVDSSKSAVSLAAMKCILKKLPRFRMNLNAFICLADY